jgi:hypothetical protein
MEQEVEIWVEYDRYPAGMPFKDGSRTWTSFEVSNWGNVRKRSGKTGLYKPVNPKPCGGSGEFRFLGLPSNRHKYVHRLVAQAFVPNPDPQTLVYVHHIDGNPVNNHWTNLRWVSKREQVGTTKIHKCPYCSREIKGPGIGNHKKACGRLHSV